MTILFRSGFGNGHAPMPDARLLTEIGESALRNMAVRMSDFRVTTRYPKTVRGRMAQERASQGSAARRPWCSVNCATEE